MAAAAVAAVRVADDDADADAYVDDAYGGSGNGQAQWTAAPFPAGTFFRRTCADRKASRDTFLLLFLIGFFTTFFTFTFHNHTTHALRVFRCAFYNISTAIFSADFFLWVGDTRESMFIAGTKEKN